MSEDEIYLRMEEFRKEGLEKMEAAGIHLNSGLFPDPRQAERLWFCFSTAIVPVWLMLQCAKTGAHGVVKDPTLEEWNWAFDCPSDPKLWVDNERVTVMEEGE